MDECLDLVAASLAQSTWKRYDSAFRLWKLFNAQNGKKCDFLDANSWCENFIVWGWSVRRLATSTLKIYLAEIKKVTKFGLRIKNTGG